MQITVNAIERLPDLVERLEQKAADNKVGRGKVVGLRVDQPDQGGDERNMPLSDLKFDMKRWQSVRITASRGTQPASSTHRKIKSQKKTKTKKTKAHR